MSEAEPIPPTSSVTALRIPMIKKGEYDLWSMKMRQYIAITDHILWDIITNGDQATTDPASSSAPKTSLAANARRNNEKALNILLSAIPDRHLLSFHDATDAKTLWSAIKARFGGNEASKKMQKNLLKQQFETFTIGSREELDSAYERFQNILSMLELYDAKVSNEDANLKFLRSLPSVWHVVATMIRGQPGLDELEFDDLYNNLKVNIPKGYTQAPSSKVQTAPNCASHSDEIICSFFAQQASMPTTHDDEDLLQIDEDARKKLTFVGRQKDSMQYLHLQETHRSPSQKEVFVSNSSTSRKVEITCQYMSTQAVRSQVKKASTVGSQVVLPQSVSVKGSAMIKPTQTWRPKGAYLDSVNRDNGSYTLKQFEAIQKKISMIMAIMDSGGKESREKGTNQASCIDFEKVSYVEELKFNLLSVSQICDKKHNVLFTDKECLILSPKFKFVDEDLVILRAPRKNDVYSLDLKNIIPSGGVTCLVAKATKDEAVLWHRRLGHVNFKNINKLVKGNLVRGLPSKTFKLDHSCLACRKGKQHRASCKKIEVRTVREPLELLHMDLFGPVSVESINRKKYCLVVTDDCSKFSWVFFLAYKDETYDMLHDLIVGLENKLRHKVKTIRCDHGTEFKNHLMNEFCAKKGIKREYSIARTPQQNGVAERKNRTLIEAARTMLADSLLPIQFWAEAVNTACYVLNRVLVTKPQMKTPYEILMGRSPNISFMRPFGCPLTILNTLDHLGKFDGKSDEGYLLGYSTNSKGFRVYNRVTRKVQDCLHVNFLENQENQKGKGPDWMFDLELLTPL
ncbi:putative ribonuclease H-like domain-containing protein [Tanacetum coccineum]